MPRKEYENLNRLSKHSALIPVLEGRRKYNLPFKPTDINATFIFVKDKETKGWFDLTSVEGFTVDDNLYLANDFDLNKYSEIFVREIVSAPSEVVDYTTIRALTIDQLKADQKNAVDYLKYFYDLVEKRMLKFTNDTSEKRKLLFPEPGNNQGYFWTDESGWQVFDLYKWKEEFEAIKAELHRLVLAQLNEDLVQIEASLKTTVEVYAKEKLDMYTEDVIKPGITNHVDNELVRIEQLFSSLIDKVFAIRGEIPVNSDWHTLEDGLWTVRDFKAGNFTNAPENILESENSGYVQMFTDKTSGYKVVRYLAGTTMFFAMYRDGVWTEYSKIQDAQLGNAFKINQPNHGFVFSPVALQKQSDNSSIWVKVRANKGADGIATRIDDNNFLLTVSGEVTIPVGAVDDKGESLLEDEYYFTSETKPGFVQKDLPFRYHQSIVHVAYTNERGFIGDVKLTPVFDQTPTFLDEATQEKMPVLFKEDMYELEYPQLDNTTSKNIIGAIKETKSVANSKVSKNGDNMTGSLQITTPDPSPLVLYRTAENKTNINIRFANSVGNHYLGYDNGELKTGTDQDLSVGNKIYHQGFKPTPQDIGAIKKSGDTMTGQLYFGDNRDGIARGNLDGASFVNNNLRLQSWNGIGFAPTINGVEVPTEEYSHWFNTRNGDAGFRGSLVVNKNVEISTQGYNFIAPNNYGYMGKDTQGTPRYMLWIDPQNKIRIGHNNEREIKTDGYVVAQKGIYCKKDVDAVPGGYAQWYAKDDAPLTSEVARSSIKNAYSPGLDCLDDASGGFFIKYGLGLLRPSSNVDEWGKIQIIGVVDRNSTTVKQWDFNLSSGDFTTPGNVIQNSDIKLKKDLELIPNALEKIQAINGYTYTRKDTDKRQTGVVAQEVQAVLPEAVTVNIDAKGEETLGVSYGNIVGLLIEGIKEQQKQIDELKMRLEK